MRSARIIVRGGVRVGSAVRGLVCMKMTVRPVDTSVAETLRADPVLHAMRIIAVTGRASEEDRQRSREAGIDYYVVKPMGLDYIVSLVGNAAPRPQPI